VQLRGRSSTHTSPGSGRPASTPPRTRRVPFGRLGGRTAPARNAPPCRRGTRHHVSESGVPRAAANAPENPNMPWAIESSVPSSANVGADRAREKVAGAGSARAPRSRSTLARASRPSESSEPQAEEHAREPASGAFSATSRRSLTRREQPPASQPSSRASTLRLSASEVERQLAAPRCPPRSPTV